jgi:hypothetical protein
MAQDIQFKARVSKLYEARFGGGSFGLEGHDRQYFNTKNALPGFVVPGATIEFTAQLGRNGKSYFVTDASLREVAGAPAPAPSPGGGPSLGSRDSSIMYQSARKDALVMVGLLVGAGVLYTDKTPKAKVGGILEDAVDRFTALYYEDISSLGALERVPPVELGGGETKATPPREELPE